MACPVPFFQLKSREEPTGLTVWIQVAQHGVLGGGVGRGARVLGWSISPLGFFWEQPNNFAYFMSECWCHADLQT